MLAIFLAFTAGIFATILILVLIAYILLREEEYFMPEVKKEEKQTGNFIVVTGDYDVEMFNNLDDAREYVEDLTEKEDVRVFRITQEYKVKESKKVLFSKV